MTQESDIHGILIINKPKGPSSHSVVLQVRKALRVRAGHTGTLDPMATGVLPVVVGKGTRLARFYQNSDKRYRAVIQLGEETDTYDAEGNIVKQSQVPAFSDEDVLQLLQSFQGEQEQLPPLFSAIKVGGKRLYKTARKNETVERPIRKVCFHSIDLVEKSLETLTIDVHCSSGTYIRSLAYDIGRKVGCGAHLSSLLRTHSGPFVLEDAIPPEEIHDRWQKALITLELLLPDVRIHELSPDEANLVCHGNSIPGDPEISGTLRLMYRSRLIAIGESSNGSVKPTIVLRTEI